MPLARCPFCPSGQPWNACGCRYALIAQREGLIAARQAYRDAAPAAPQKPQKSARSSAAIPAPAEGSDAAPWLAAPGCCPSCDRRRAAGIRAMQRSRARRADTLPDTLRGDTLSPR